MRTLFRILWFAGLFVALYGINKQDIVLEGVNECPRLNGRGGVLDPLFLSVSGGWHSGPGDDPVIQDN